MTSGPTAPGDWNPYLYLKFEAERLRPARDLIGCIALAGPGRVFDLGCGTGTVTRLLAERWPAARVTGIDNSREMLGRAREVPSAIEWVEADLTTWRAPAPADLLFSNAGLHWLGNHASLFPRLAAMLVPGGVLAVQMPRNFDAPSHTAIAESARAGPWASDLTPLLEPSPVAEPAAYYDLVAPHVAEIDVWETEYLHALTGACPVLEWTEGTALRPFLEALPSPTSREAFVADYRSRLLCAYPPRADGVTLFPFRRLFLLARR